MRKHIGLGLIASIMVACAPQEEVKDAAVSATEGKGLQAVTITTIEEMNFEHYFNVHGTVEVEKNALVFPQAGGRIIDIKVTEGAKVSKGQVIATIDADVLSASMDEVSTQWEEEKMAENARKRKVTRLNLVRSKKQNVKLRVITSPPSPCSCACV